MNEPHFDLDHVEVDVEPLGDPRWTRIERGTFAKLERPPAAWEASRALGRRVWIGGVCALAIVATLAVFVARPPSSARSNDPVRLVTTGSPSRFTIGESSLWIEPRSLVLVSGDEEHGVDVVLDRGTVTCEVAPRRGRPPFVVDAGEVRVKVVGTRFTVTRGSTETSVAVDHGVVEVAVGGIVSVVHDGQRWPTPIVGSAPVVAESAPETAGDGPASPGEATSPPGASTDAPLDSPHAAWPPRRVTPSAGASGSVSARPSAAPSVAPPSVVPPAPQSPQRLFEAAARIERTQPDDAARLYRDLAQGGTAWAGSALFALGRLEADRGRRPEATRLLEQYLARFPRGINADDARALLQHLQ